MHVTPSRRCFLSVLACLVWLSAAGAGENWPQVKYDAHRSGNVPGRQVSVPLGLVTAVPLTDAVLTAPVC
ncbi:MAG: hypothetical protein ACYC6Y_26995, partial [Thermoguttaceae bacterium]